MRRRRVPKADAWLGGAATMYQQSPDLYFQDMIREQNKGHSLANFINDVIPWYIIDTGQFNQ